MSTFDGIINEYPLISIDNFQRCNYKSTVFFLSHCHADHQRGLNDQKFFHLLESRGFSRIYVSDLSKHLLKNDQYYAQVSEYVETLPEEEPTIISVPNENGEFHSKITVTLLPAAHCPGSVMFLIEGSNGRVLYTGDFRLPIGGSARLHHLHKPDGKLKPIDSLYVDTTFCKKEYMNFPPREKCLNALFDLIEPWLNNGPNYIIAFHCPAQYNYEFLFVELYKKLGIKIHVREDKARKYNGVKVLEDCITDVSTETRIHACNPVKNNLFAPGVPMNIAPCGFHSPDGSLLEVLVLKPCAMSFKNGTEDLVFYDPAEQLHKVCFSSHSSLAEVKDMVQYLKPKIVYPNVVKKQSIEEILSLLNVPPQVPDSSSSDYSMGIHLGSLQKVQEDNPLSLSNSFPFYDTCYQIPAPADNTNSVTARDRADPRHSEEESERFQEPALRDGTSKEGNGRSVRKTQVPVPSELKWDCPLFSSNDENLDPNSSCGSSQDTFDDESTPSNSEEQNVACPESKTVLKSLPNSYSLYNNLFPKVMTTSVDNNVPSTSKAYSSNLENPRYVESNVVLKKISPTTKNNICGNVDLCKSAKVNDFQISKTTYNPLELLFSQTSIDSDSASQSDQIPSKDTSLTSVRLENPCYEENNVVLEKSCGTNEDNVCGIVNLCKNAKVNDVQIDNTTYNPLEVLFSQTSNIDSNSTSQSDQIPPKDTSSLISVVKEQNELAVSNFPSDDKPPIASTSHVLSDCENQTGNAAVSCIQNHKNVNDNLHVSWRSGKLIDESALQNSNSELPDTEKSNNSVNQIMTVIGKSRNEDSDSQGQSSWGELEYFSKLIEQVSEHDRKSSLNNSKDNVSSKNLNTVKNINMNPNTHSCSNKPPAKSNFVRPEVLSTSEPICGADCLDQKLNLPGGPSKNKIAGNSSKSIDKPHSRSKLEISQNQSLNSLKHKPFSSSSQIIKPSFSMSKCSFNIQPSQLYFKPNPHKDVSASKFEKSLYSVKKKTSPKFLNNVDDGDDIVILSVPNMKQLSGEIEVIDLSSDDEDDDLTFTEPNSILGEKRPGSSKPSFRNGKDVEILQPSQSLLTSNNIPEASSSREFRSISGVRCNKRKSSENEFTFIKCLRTESSPDRAECSNKIEADYDSTPEDLLIVGNIQETRPSHDIICITDDS